MYLQPEPLLRSPYLTATYAYAGLATPAYSYGMNNPITAMDVDGLINVPVGASGIAILKALQTTAVGRELAEWTAKQPEIFQFEGENLSGKHQYGDIDASQLKSKGLVRVIVDIDAIRKAGPNVRVVPEVVAHECSHAVDSIKNPRRVFGEKQDINFGEWDAYTVSAKVRQELELDVKNWVNTIADPQQVPPGLRR